MPANLAHSQAEDNKLNKPCNLLPNSTKVWKKQYSTKFGDCLGLLSSLL